MERSLTHIALFTALIAALGLVPPIALSFGVPIHAQSLGVMLAGAVLGAKRGALAVLLLLFLVACGLPLLAGGRGGLGVFASPTVGYLLGWLPASFVTGALMEKLPLRPGPSAGIAAIIGGVFLLALCGALGMSLILARSYSETLWLAAAFLPGDLIKAALTGMLVANLARMRPSSLLSRHR